jgi:branched-chain amino acid transport system ATP-binding protein
MTDDAVITVSGIAVSYGGRTVLEVDALTVARGECIGLFGNNGSGKSTLLRAITGLTPIDRGSIVLAGQRAHKWPTYQRVNALQLAFLPQRGIVFPELTVEENLRVAEERHGGGARWNIVPAEIEALVGEDDPLVRLWRQVIGRRREFAGNLSGGERRALGLLLALRRKPSLVLLDEPLAGLTTKPAILTFLRKLHETGITIVICEQNVREMLTIAGRAIILKNGVVAYDGPAGELREDPSRTLAIL